MQAFYDATFPRADAAKAYEEALKHNPHIEGLREHIEKLRAAAGERKT